MRNNSTNWGLGNNKGFSYTPSGFGAAADDSGLTLNHLGSPLAGNTFISLNAAITRTYNTGFKTVNNKGIWLANSGTVDRNLQTGNTLTENGTVPTAAVASGAELTAYGCLLYTSDAADE